LYGRFIRPKRTLLNQHHGLSPPCKHLEKAAIQVRD
jgi:hypothetical protein